MKMRVSFFLAFALCLVLVDRLAGQVGINTDGSNPDTSAMLDVKSSSRGMLVPRLTTAQRTAIASPAKGLLVFDNTTNTFWFHNGMAWTNLVGTGSDTEIKDTDGNTRVQTEANPNEDIIRFKMGGTGNITMTRNAAGVPRIELFSNLNTVVGEAAGVNITPGTNPAGVANSLFGHQSGNAITAGFFNCGFGAGTLTATTLGNDNSAFGIGALRFNTIGRFNVGVGSGALYNSTTADGNTGLGFQALNSSTTGNFNTATGFQSLYSTTTGATNTASGYASGNFNTIGIDNAFFGFRAGYHNISGNSNVFLGRGAGESNTTANDNTFIGTAAGGLNTTGTGNAFFGRSAGFTNAGANDNTFIGTVAGFGNTSGTSNTFLGRSCGYTNSTASQNTLLGAQAGFNNNGSANTFVGYLAGFATTSGGNNVYLGSLAGNNNVTGSGNVFLGFSAGKNETASNRLYIENSLGNASAALIYGEFDNDVLRVNNKLGIGRTPTTNALEVSGDFVSKNLPGSWAANSDRRLKKNIQYLDHDPEEALRQLLLLRGVRYEWNDDKTGIHRPAGLQTGFIAQDIQKVFPEKVALDQQGFLQTAYGDYDPLLVESLRALDQRSAGQEVRIEALEAENAALKAQIEAIYEKLGLPKKP